MIDPHERLRAEAAPLRRLRRARRRLSSFCFLVAGVGFGTAFYLLRVRFAVLRTPDKGAAFLGLVALTVVLFYFGARLESEVGRLDEQLQRIEEQAQSLHRR